MYASKSKKRTLPKEEAGDKSVSETKEDQSLASSSSSSSSGPRKRTTGDVLRKGFNDKTYADCVLRVHHRSLSVLKDTMAASSSSGSSSSSSSSSSMDGSLDDEADENIGLHALGGSVACQHCANAGHTTPVAYNLLRIAICEMSEVFYSMFVPVSRNKNSPMFLEQVERCADFTVDSWAEHVALDMLLKHAYEPHRTDHMVAPPTLKAHSDEWFGVMAALLMLADRLVAQSCWDSTMGALILAAPYSVNGAIVLSSIPSTIWESRNRRKGKVRALLDHMDAALFRCFLPLETGCMHPQFTELSGDIVERLLQHPQAALSEETVWAAAARWIEARLDEQTVVGLDNSSIDTNARDALISRVVDSVKFAGLPPAFITACVIAHPIVFRHPPTAAALLQRIRPIMADSKQRKWMLTESMCEAREPIQSTGLIPRLDDMQASAPVIIAARSAMRACGLEDHSLDYVEFTVSARERPPASGQRFVWTGVPMYAKIKCTGTHIKLVIKAHWDEMGCDQLSGALCGALVIATVGKTPITIRFSEVTWKQRTPPVGASKKSAPSSSSSSAMDVDSTTGDELIKASSWSVVLYEGSFLEFQLQFPGAAPNGILPICVFLVHSSVLH
jgi:hypothetical protein